MTKRFWKRIAAFCAAIVMGTACCLQSSALPINNNITDTYFYNQNGQAVASPVSYRPVKVLSYRDMGATATFVPADMFVRNEYLYVLDQGGNQILILDASYNKVATINELKDTATYTVPDLNYYIYNEDGTREEDSALKKANKYSFKSPSGIYVTEDEEIYVADTENKRIVVCDIEGNCLQVYQNPSVDALGITFEFKPQKLVVDDTGTMSIISYGVNRGLLQLDSNGVFIQFFAAPKILVSVTEWVASLFQSQEEKAKIRNVAAEYGNVAMDSRGFIYTTATDTTSVAALRKLSFDGTDVLNQTDAKFTVIGDVETTDTTSPQIVDVAVNDEANTYTVLDARMGRFFTYNSTGMLLCIGGGSGNQFGRFKAPNVIECRDNQIIVADSGNKTITVYEMTDYATCVNDAFAQYKAGEYEEASELFERVAKYNSNMYVAYEYLGNIQKLYGSQADDDDPMRLQYYRNALEYYKLSETKQSYSECYALLRNAELSNYFYIIFFSAIIIIIGIIVLIYVRKYRKNRAEEQRRLDSQ